MTLLFIDTNVLLHFRRLEEIDWLDLSKCKEAVIVLCSVVVRELDRHKVNHPQNKFRKRAQEIIAALHPRHSRVDSDTLRSGVRLEFIAEDPGLDFGAHNLQPELADDWLIASILDWKLKHPSDETKLVSADLGISIKAKAKGISTLEPLEADRLAEELDADEKRIKKLQEELAEIKNAQPDLKLCFGDGQNVTRVKVLSPTAFDANHFEVEMEQIRANHPLYPLSEELKDTVKGGYLSFIKRESFTKLLPQEEILRYNASLETFYGEYEKYLRAVHEHQNMERRTIQFEVALENNGSSPAEDVDIHIHFPDGFQLFDTEDNKIPEPPEQPDSPQKPGMFRLNIDSRTLAAITSSCPPSLRLPGPPSNVSPPSIRRSNSYDVNCHVGSAKHNYRISVAQFLAVFDSYDSVNSFQIDYSILAANIPKPTTGHLSVVVESETSQIE